MLYNDLKIIGIVTLSIAALIALCLLTGTIEYIVLLAILLIFFYIDYAAKYIKILLIYIELKKYISKEKLNKVFKYWLL